jgi:hypothetical protein
MLVYFLFLANRDWRGSVRSAKRVDLKPLFLCRNDVQK